MQSSNKNKDDHSLNVESAIRKNSLFDQLIDDINEFNENLDYHYPLPTQKQVLVVSKSVPIIHVSRHSNRNQDSQEDSLLIMEDIQENEPLRISSLKEKSTDCNKMSSFSSHLRKNHPKSLRFRFEDSLMNQNVDENEEYEQISKTNKNLETNSILSESLTKNNTKANIELDKNPLNAIDSGINDGKKSDSRKFGGTQQSNTSTDSPAGSTRSGKQYDDSQQSTKSQFLHTTKAKKHKYIKKSLNPKLVKNDLSIIPKDVFIELEQLTNDQNNENPFEWSEVARWIKYEQSLTVDSNVWSKPFVGPLIYQSLLYLKTGLQYGTVLLNADFLSKEQLMDEIIQDFADSGHMNKENKEQIKRVLLSPHRHCHTISSSGSKRSNLSDMFSQSQSSSNSRRTSANDQDHEHLSRKNSFIHFTHEHRFRNKSVKLSSSEIDLENRMQADKPNVPSIPAINLEDHNLDNNVQFHSIHKNRRSTIALIRNTLTHSKAHKDCNSKGLSSDTEAFAILVGVVEFLDRPVMAFVRLTNCTLIDEMVELNLKTRFIFILLGPKNENIDYLEIGRCIGTLMQNKEFRECAFRTNDRRELTDSITNFMNRSLCLVLPVGNFDDDLMSPMIEWIQNKIKKKSEKTSNIEIKIYDRRNSTVSARNNIMVNSKKSIEKQQSQENQQEIEEEEPDPFQRTDFPFGCLINELRNRYSGYLSDFTDGLNFHCLIAFVFTFTVCIAPALSFGGILADKTEKWLGVNEMLLATSINGVIAGFFSGQPLMIYGETGPFLVFEEMLFYFCQKLCLEYLAVRCWIALWILFFCLLMLAFEGVYIINYVTRFTEEIFAFLMACVFLTDAFKKIIKIFYHDPVYTAEKYCSLRHPENFTQLNYTQRKSEDCPIYRDENYANEKNHVNPNPNIALLSLILMIGTCVIALVLKKLRRSMFFGAYVRRTLSDVGILISIILMVLVDYIIQSETGVITQKLDIPKLDSIVPTKYRKSWLVSPLGNNFEGANTMDSNKIPVWVPFICIGPAFLIFIVLFFEVEVTQLILSAKHRKLVKGSGYNLDLLIAGLMITLNSFFGLPWMCAAPVRTLAHWASLTVYSTTYVPGEKPKLMTVREQRVTNICVHLAIGLCLMAKSILKMIPISVLFGIFLYFGIVSLSGTQLYERIKLIFIPSKYCPNVVYARGVRPSKRNFFTLIQFISVILMLLMKSFNRISFIFPVFLVLLVPFRAIVLPRIFTAKELEQLDHDKDDQDNESETALDFYELTHLPI